MTFNLLFQLLLVIWTTLVGSCTPPRAQHVLACSSVNTSYSADHGCLGAQNFTVNECGAVHITMGDGGNIEGLCESTWALCFEPIYALMHSNMFRLFIISVHQYCTCRLPH